MFTSRERKQADVEGKGIQYIPGHKEPFIDHVISRYAAREAFHTALDLGGGGFRFALPASQFLEKILVVDIDPSALSIDMIIDRLETIGNDSRNFKPNRISTRVSDILEFISRNEMSFDVILLSRVVHFFTPGELVALIGLLRKKARKDTIICISAITTEDQYTHAPNEFHANSTPVAGEHYRKFKDTDEARSLMKEQNFGEHIHLFTKEYMEAEFGEDFLLVEEPMWATRTVLGFVFRKTS